MLHLSSFPKYRARRLRQSAAVRTMVAEARLDVQDLIWPIFVRSPHAPASIQTLPGVLRYTLEDMIEAVSEAHALGLRSVALFPLTDAHDKSDDAREALNPDNLICSAVRMLKRHFSDICVITDVALDPYTSHGHDGLVRGGDVDNDATVAVLCQQAIVQAQAGADVVAPSDMMDGRIGAIRDALDAAHLQNTMILAYSAKYASALYGPFREAVGSQQRAAIDKRTYQMDPANLDEALHEVAHDLAEGADMVMVKPGLFYLDVLAAVVQTFKKPTCVYQVSGEFAMLKSAGAWASYETLLLESLLAFKRAGATAILTYGAVDAARCLQSSHP